MIRGISVDMGEERKDRNTESRDSIDADVVRGLDARRKAERMAEEAGRKIREKAAAESEGPEETGGPEGLEPTRYGDWEKAGRCIDF